MKMTKEQWADFVTKAASHGIILDIQKVSEERKIEIQKMRKTGPIFVDYHRLMS